MLLSPGPVVSYRAFKHGKRSVKNIAEAEYNKTTESLQEDGFGRIEQFSVPRARGQCEVFVKSKPEPWPNSATVTNQKFDSALSKQIHSDITVPMCAFFTSKQLHFILETMASLPFAINFFIFAFKLIETSWEGTCSIRINFICFGSGPLDRPRQDVVEPFHQLFVNTDKRTLY